MINNNLTIKQAHEHLVNGDFTALELAEQYLRVIEEKNPDINAYLEVFDDVREQAKHADEQIKNGVGTALTGIPLGVKDNILIKGKVASAASKILENYHATYDATAIARLKDVGAVFLGRTNMDEFAMGASTEQSAYGVTKNPHDTTRVPGGSSGGSAAAVAMHGCMGALGSDTAGSIRQPAALCGVVGLKPTYGSVSRHGLIALGSSLDVIGPLARNVEDVEILFEAIKGKDVLDTTTVDATDYKPQTTNSSVTIGIPRHFIEHEGIDERVVKNFNETIEQLKTLGYTVQDIELPNTHLAVPAYYVILPAEASSNLARFDGVKYGLRERGEDLLGEYLVTRGKGFGPEPRRRIMLGTYVLSAGYYDAYYNRAQAVRRLIGEDFTHAFSDVDIIATPTTAGPAFKLGEKVDDPVKMYLEDVFTVPANHTGLPALSVPSGTITEEGVELPLGIQFVAPHMEESRLFEVGKILLRGN